jgi:broad specificity phosphatase PhoE
MTSRLLLLCHGMTAAQRAARFPVDEPLEEPAVAATLALKGRLPLFQRCSTSPALRARDTARFLEIAATAEPALADADYGRWKGISMAEIAEREPKGIAAWLADSSARPHGGESIRDLMIRVGGWLDSQMAASGRALAITHQAVIRAAIAHVLGAGATAFWRIDVEPLSLTELSSDGRRWNLRLPAASKGD